MIGYEFNNAALYTLQFLDDQVVEGQYEDNIEYMMRNVTEEYESSRNEHQ